ncbi:MAG TPA: OB-fold domain-containing protein [Nocardioidaceae bacterium]|nr:OB-fold domain-containing protein [Nocardioidaceae bacterium]
MAGLVSYGSYVPYWRLAGAAISPAAGGRGSKGSRSVAAYDEDTTTMAVAAARAALAAGDVGCRLDSLSFVTSNPPYVEKTNATAIHSALGLAHQIRCTDTGGAARSGLSALIGALRSTETTLVTVSETVTGPVGSPEERSGGDAAAAFVVGDRETIADLLGAGSVSDEFTDRWRQPGDPWAKTWEERFGERIYARLAAESFALALKDADVLATDVDRYAVVGLSRRAAAGFASSSGVAPDRILNDLVPVIGNSGAAQPAVALAAMLDVAEPGDIIAVTMLADGADTVILRATDLIASRRQPAAVAAQIAAGNDKLSYTDFLLWKGHLTRQPPRRPDPDRAAAPPAHRAEGWKFAFTGSECNACGTRHLPPQQVCLECGATADMSPQRLADTPATVVTYTIDHLAYSPAPPVIGVVVDFEGGGRFTCELTDSSPDTVAIGQRVEMTFRRLSDTQGIHNYFWKARPVTEPTTERTSA